jgi:GTPase SAR1 family protein
LTYKVHIQMTLNIHQDIKDKLDFFIKSDKIPNIIFHGQSGSGKRTLVSKFVSNIYNDNKDVIKEYVMDVNCAHGKGIKFIREELKFFAKTHINSNETTKFKTIILSNADKLTIDAQSALRRCIELFSHTTRFFIIVEDKYKLLKPILSRLCEIYVSSVYIDNTKINLYKHGIQEVFSNNNVLKKRTLWLKKELEKYFKNPIKNNILLMELSTKLYEKGYSGIDIINYIETEDIEPLKKYKFLLIFNKIKKEFRNEKLLMLYILNFLFLRSDVDLENISFI